MEEVDPRARRWLVAWGAGLAICEWAAALGARYSVGDVRTLLGAAAIFLAILIFLGSLFWEAGFGKAGFKAHLRANVLLYSAVAMGFTLYALGPLRGPVFAVILGFVGGLAATVRQTWGYGGRYSKGAAPPRLPPATSNPKRRALAYFLFGLGLPISVAFLYPFLPSRDGPLWSQMDGSPRALTVLLGGGAVGLALTAGGLWALLTVSAETRRRQ